MQFFCVFILSPAVFSASLFPPESSRHCWWRSFCIFSPAACAGYPVWSNIPGGDRSKLPGKFVIFILNVSVFPVVFVVDVFVVVVVHPYSGTLRLCQCSDSVVTSAWNSSQGLTNKSGNKSSLWRNPFVQWNHICFLQTWLIRMKSVDVLFVFLIIHLRWICCPVWLLMMVFIAFEVHRHWKKACDWQSSSLFMIYDILEEHSKYWIESGRLYQASWYFAFRWSLYDGILNSSWTALFTLATKGNTVIPAVL